MGVVLSKKERDELIHGCGYAGDSACDANCGSCAFDGGRMEECGYVREDIEDEAYLDDLEDDTDFNV